MKSLLTTTVFFVSIISAVAQSTFSFNYNFFADVYSSRTNHVTPDGGFIQSGRSGNNLVLVKVDACYREEWSRSYNLGVSGYETSVHPYLNNGFVVGNQNSGAVANFNVTRVDNAGNIVWAKNFSAAANLNLNAIDVDANNNIFISASYYRATFDNDFFMMLLDSSGNIIWNKTWGGGNGGAQVSWEQAYTGMVTSDGGYLMAGRHFGTNDTSFWSAEPQLDNAVVLKLNNNGDLQWAKSFGGNIYECFFDACEIPGGGIVLGGTVSSNAYGGAGWDAYLLKLSTDNAGNFLSADWARNIGDPNLVSDEDIFGITYNNGKIFCGGLYGNGSENFLMAFNTLGNDLGIGKKYSGFYLHSLIPKPDGGLVFIDHNSWSSMRLVKTDSLLETNAACVATPLNASIKNADRRIGNPGPSIQFGVVDGGLNVTDITSAITNGALSILRSNICPSAPNTQVSFNADNANICPGSCINFQNTTTGDVLCYEWAFPGSVTLSSTDVNPANVCYNQNGTYDVQLTAYTIHGGIDSVSQNLIQVAGQNFLTVTGNEIDCPTDSLVLTASGGSSYLWSNGATTASITVAAIEGNEYYVIAELGNCQDSVGVSLIVNGTLPEANFTVTQQGNAVGFKNLSVNADSFEWDFGFNNANSNDVDPNFTYTNEGIYEICLTASNNCGNDTYCETITIAINSINESKLNNDLTVFPNPANTSSIVTISLNNAFNYINEEATISVIDTKGKIIYQESWILDKTKKQTLNLKEKKLSAGVYQIMLQSKKLVKNIKLIVI